MCGVRIIRIKKLYAGLGVLIFLCSGVGVYLLAVQYTQLLRLEEDILLTSETTEVPETLDFTTQVIFHALSILGQIGVLVGLVLLTIRTKSKGYLFFMGKGIGKLGIIVMLVYLKQNVGTLQSYAFVKKMDSPSSAYLGLGIVSSNNSQRTDFRTTDPESHVDG